MKFTQLAVILFFGIGIISCQNSSNVSINTKADSVSYVIGAYQGDNMLNNFEQSKLDSLIDMKLYFEGFYTALKGKEPKINPDSNKATLTNFFQTMQTSQMMAARDTTGTVKIYSPDKSLIDSISYLLGADMGKGFNENFEKNGLDTILNVSLIIEGYVTAIKKEELKLEAKPNMQMVDVFFKKLREEQMMAEHGGKKAEGEEFLAKNKALSEITETASGLQYEILVEGNGAIPKISDKVKVHYHGTFVNGEVFDSSVDRGEPTTFGVGQVIRGWTEALQLMPVGSKWKLFIPYDIAYGPQGRGSIPPYSMLIFEVELLEIVK